MQSKRMYVIVSYSGLVSSLESTKRPAEAESLMTDSSAVFLS